MTDFSVTAAEEMLVFVNNLTAPAKTRLIEQMAKLVQEHSSKVGETVATGFLLGDRFVTFMKSKQIKEEKIQKKPIHPDLVDDALAWDLRVKEHNHNIAIMMALLKRFAECSDSRQDMINYIPDIGIQYLPFQYDGMTKFIKESHWDTVENAQSRWYKQLRAKVTSYVVDNML